MSETALFWSAVAVVGLAFACFAWMFVSALREGTENYARTMGAETARQFEDVFMFVSPAKIARLGRLAALAAGLRVTPTPAAPRRPPGRSLRPPHARMRLPAHPRLGYAGPGDESQGDGLYPLL